MKKLLLGLGTLATVVAPIATVIACGGVQYTTPSVKGKPGDGQDGNKSGDGQDGNKFGDGQDGNGGVNPTQPIDNVTKVMLGGGTANQNTDGTSKQGLESSTFFNAHKYSAFKMNGEEIAEAILNTKANGQLNISDSTMSKWGSIAGSDIDETKSNVGFNGSLVLATENPTLTIDIKKSELVADADVIEQKGTEIKNKLGSTKKYIYKIDETIKDTDANDGEWKMSFYEMKDSSPTLVKAINTLKNDFDFDIDGAIKEMGGMYLYGQHHIFSESISGHNIISDFGGVKPDSSGFFSSLFGGGDKYKDRAAKDNLVDWAGYKPKSSSDLATIKNSLKNIEIDASFVLDAKSLKPKLRLNVFDNISKQLETVYIDSGDAFDFSKTVTLDDFKNIWSNNFKFSIIFSKINKLKASADQMLEQHVPGVALKMFDFVSLVNTLARTSDFNQTTDFMSTFYNWLRTQSNINVDSLVNGMLNFNYDELDDTMSIGCKGWTGFNDAFILGQKLNEFLEAELQNHVDWTLEKVKTIEDFNQKLIDDAFKPQKVKEAKDFLDNHNPKISYADMTDDDILALVIKTKLDDNKVAIAALGSVVSTFKTKFDTLDDSKRNISGKDVFSQKAKDLGKFVDDNANAIFGDKWVSPGFMSISGTSGKWASSFEEVTEDEILVPWMTSHKKTGDYSVSSYINNILKVVLSGKDFSKLQAIVLTPLGL